MGSQMDAQCVGSGEVVKEVYKLFDLTSALVIRV